MDELEMQIMQIIINAGDCKNHAYTALELTKEGKYDEADAEMQLARDAMAKAHDSQTEMLQKEAAGEKVPFSILFVHAQDHLMTALSEQHIVEELIAVTKKVNELQK